MGSVFAVAVCTLHPYMVLATISYFCILSGVLLRKERNSHAVLMGFGIFLDLAIVLTLEFQRHAIDTALGSKLTTLQQLHVGSSTIAVALYFPVVALGLTRFMKKGEARTGRIHKNLGIAAFVFRTLGFILMFSLLMKKP